MALDDLAACFEGKLIKRVAELAESPADGRDQTAASKLPPRNEPASPARSSDLLPEAEDLAGRHHRPTQCAKGDSKVLDLAELHPALGELDFRP